MHTDVSLLLDAGQSSSEVKATYGYKVYGGEDLNLTRGLASEVQRNPYRFNAKRLDSGSATLDMGARRYNNDYGRFIQRDAFMESESDLALDLGARTQNRSLFAASNPVNLIEVDGHDAIGRLRDAFRGLRDAMTDADVRWCRSNIPTCIKVAETVIDAYTYMNLKRNGGHFGRDRSEGRADAFRHCCWSGLMSLTVGSETAATVGKNHEDFPRPSFRERNSKSMDLHNNFIGRQIGDKAFVKTPGKLDALVVQQLGMGMWKELLVVDDCMKQTKPGGRLWMLSRRCIADGRDIGSRLIWPDGRLVVPSAPKAARGLTCSERPVRRRGGF